jgi:hypothetical protein
MEERIDVDLSEVSRKGNDYGMPLLKVTPLILSLMSGNCSAATLLKKYGASLDDPF